MLKQVVISRPEYFHLAELHVIQVDLERVDSASERTMSHLEIFCLVFHGSDLIKEFLFPEVDVISAVGEFSGILSLSSSSSVICLLFNQTNLVNRCY